MAKWRRPPDRGALRSRLGRSYQIIVDDARKRWFMKKVWNKPELRRLVAGGAESQTTKTGVDGNTKGGGNNYS